MALRLYDTASRQKTELDPIDPGTVRIYVCGPTVYDLAHIGNARPVIVFDVLFRLLRQVYGADHVVYARNITDVDDKINARALERGITIRDLTDATLAQFRGRRRRARLPAADARAAGHRLYRGDEGDHRAPSGARCRLCRRGARALLGRRDGRSPDRSALWLAGAPSARRDAGGRARRRRALQARPDGFRVVEAVHGRPARLAEPGRHRHAGASRLAYRMLGDVDGQAARPLRRRLVLRRSSPQRLRYPWRRHRPRLPAS